MNNLIDGHKTNWTKNKASSPFVQLVAGLMSWSCNGPHSLLLELVMVSETADLTKPNDWSVVNSSASNRTSWSFTRSWNKNWNYQWMIPISCLHWTILVLFCVDFILWSVFPLITFLWCTQGNFLTLTLCSYLIYSIVQKRTTKREKLSNGGYYIYFDNLRCC